MYLCVPLVFDLASKCICMCTASFTLTNSHKVRGERLRRTELEALLVKK